MWRFLLDNRSDLAREAGNHARIVVSALALAVPVAVLAGAWGAERRRFASAALGVAGVLITIPSYALFGLLVAPLGLGTRPAVVALALYSLLPVLRNTVVGLREVPPATLDAARGMGMSPRQVLLRVRLPLALPVVVAGVRTATVMIVGITTIAAYIAAGGLGTFVRDGLAAQNRSEVLAATLTIVALALAFDGVLALVQRLFDRRGRALRRAARAPVRPAPAGVAA
ncbi:MAG: ABC transporter permease [Actinobacteria bacterium]|nr:ABC transporter permease [Actinomycetota bacterium]